MKISGKQVSAARELLGLTQNELANIAHVSQDTIARFETGQAEPRRDNLAKIVQELQRRGIEFTNGDTPPSNSHGMGVRLNFDKAAEFARTDAQVRLKADR